MYALTELMIRALASVVPSQNVILTHQNLFFFKKKFDIEFNIVPYIRSSMLSNNTLK